MNKQEIEKWLIKYKIKNYTIHDDLTVDVDGDVDLIATNITGLPFKFGKVTGFFDIYENHNLTSLYNCPDYVGDYFDCSHNNIKSLQYCPKYVGGYFNLYMPNLEINSLRELLDIQIVGSIYINNERYKNDPAYNILNKLGKIHVYT
jgi:hypothetical protein